MSNAFKPVVVLPLQQNPVRNYNRAQLRRLLRAIGAVERCLKMGYIPNFSGLCGALTIGGVMHKAHGEAGLPEVDFSYWPSFSGRHNFQVPAIEPDLMVGHYQNRSYYEPNYREVWQREIDATAHLLGVIKAYPNTPLAVQLQRVLDTSNTRGLVLCMPENMPTTERIAMNRAVGCISQSPASLYYGVPADSRWRATNPYGTKRLELLQWLKIHAQVMQHVLKVNKGRH